MRLIGAAILTLLLVLSAWTLWHSPWSYAAQDRVQVGASSAPDHPAGTDELGRDRAVRTAAAFLLGIGGSVAASTLASLLAVSLGMATAFATPLIGRVLLFAGDLFLTLPWIFLLMMVRSALPLTTTPMTSAAVTFLLLGLLGAPAFLRVHHSRANALRSADWWLQARASGLRPAQMLRQVLPHLRPLLLTQFVLYIPACIIAEANLGTLGLGVSEPLASWGSMLQSLQNSVFLGSSRLIYLPIALLVLVLILLELLVFNTGEAIPS